MSNLHDRRQFPLWLTVSASIAVASIWGALTLLLLLAFWLITLNKTLAELTGISIAIAFVVAVASGTIVSGLLFFRKARHHRIKVDPRYCPHCDYNLTGNVSGICPECGEPIEHTSEIRDSASPP